MKVSVFGNLLVKKDSLVVGLVRELEKAIPEVDFRVEDPTEGLKPPKKGEWVILDAAEGIEKLIVIKDLDKLDVLRRSSVHDYDLAMELKLLKKLKKLGEVKIVAVPMSMSRVEVKDKIIKALS